MSRFVEVTVQDWRSYADIASLKGRHYFRGQASARWPLASSLEREYYRYKTDRLGSPTNAEYWMLHDFKRKYHLYGGSAPDDSDDFEWLALMQHHGAPTRLLDFTLSPYVAAYFAMEEATEDACVWAISWTSVRDNLHKAGIAQYEKGVLRDVVNKIQIDLLNLHIGERGPRDATAHVVPLESKRLSERASRQQGLFLAPLSVGWVGRFVPFQENLEKSFGKEVVDLAQLHVVDVEALLADCKTGFWPNSIDVVKIVLPIEMHVSGLSQLMQMGITRERLFPGLDGLAKSLSLDHLRLGL